MESLKENFPFATNERRYPIYDEKLRRTKFNFKDEQWRGEVLRENLRQQEDRLKAQIRQCMSEQAEALCHRKQQTEGNLSSLRRRVDALDELVTSMSVNSFQQYQSSLNDGLNKVTFGNFPWLLECRCCRMSLTTTYIHENSSAVAMHILVAASVISILDLYATKFQGVVLYILFPSHDCY
ncbi:centriolin-like [Narcine bancroftii]|uniref:centriolin-like n=1 Tax=Narcine bancroftii TaxID=1343680 RepID=UPI003831720B